jgi:hypothetical protein
MWRRYIRPKLTRLQVVTSQKITIHKNNSCQWNLVLIFIGKIDHDRLCGLVVSVADYKHKGPGFDSRALLRIFLRELGLERSPLSLVIG